MSYSDQQHLFCKSPNYSALNLSRYFALSADADVG